MHFRSVALELLWFLRGDSNVRWLQEHGVTIWDEWADADGDLGPVYGVQWRSWPTPDGGHIDQITDVLDAADATRTPGGMIVSAWNVGDIPQMALRAVPRVLPVLRRRRPALVPAVPAQRRPVPRRAVQHRELRAADPMVAQQVGLEPGDFVWTGGDCHIYDNHVEQVHRAAEPRRPTRSRARARAGAQSLFDYAYEDFEVVGYQHHPAIKAPVAVMSVTSA